MLADKTVFEKARRKAGTKAACLEMNLENTSVLLTALIPAVQLVYQWAHSRVDSMVAVKAYLSAAA